MVALRFESSLTTDGTNPETLKDKVGDNWKDNDMGLQARGFQGGRQPKWGFESPALTTKKKSYKKIRIRKEKCLSLCIGNKSYNLKKERWQKRFT
jgi:hypothetical protein